jgi:hypothetical protein
VNTAPDSYYSFIHWNKQKRGDNIEKKDRKEKEKHKKSEAPRHLVGTTICRVERVSVDNRIKEFCGKNKSWNKTQQLIPSEYKRMKETP